MDGSKDGGMMWGMVDMESKDTLLRRERGRGMVRKNLCCMLKCGREGKRALGFIGG